jgi:hypothetical protein
MDIRQGETSQSRGKESINTTENQGNGFFQLMNKLGDYVLNLVPLRSIFGSKKDKKVEETT